MKKYIRIIVLLVLLPVIYLLVVIIIGSVFKYKPKVVDQISKIDEDLPIASDKVYSVMIWNIGYAGLGAEMDFFYEGGESVRDSEDNTRRNLYKITEFLQANDTLDFILLQEVDNASKRSYKINQVDHLNMAMAGHFPFFATNYKVVYVPMPLMHPWGKVSSGLLSFTQHVPIETSRYSLPGDFEWPKSIFMLERCFLVNRFKLDTGKELLIINTHNSAYDDGTLRLQEMNSLKEFLKVEEAKGNSFVVGGDWNQCPSGFEPKFSGYLFDTTDLYYVNKDFLQTDWSWAYDASIPTNRRVNIPYIKGQTAVTLIDFLLTSPKVEVLSCKTIDLSFKYSDHNPVIASFKLK
jgi:endonuclease/exonuclease/phosphatase family metal-dependent hydrolase